MPQEITGEESPRKQTGKGVMIDQRVLLLGFVAVAVCAVLTLLTVFFAIRNMSQTENRTSARGNSTVSPIGPLFEAGEFTTNLAPGGEKKLIKVKVVFELSNKDVEKEVKEKLPVLNDKIILFLNSKTDEELRAENRSQLKAEIMEALNDSLQTGKIRSIYFSDLVMQ